MAEIVKRNKACSVSPLKSAPTIGAAMAFLGMNRAIPMLHGSQGCTAFGKVFFVRHFREPIPLQTTAMDQVSAVMGADERVVEGLATIAGKSAPDLIGVVTTGLSETEGCDIAMAVREFRKSHPEFAKTAVVPVAAPDYSGCLETGFAAAVLAVINALVPAGHGAGRRPDRINVLAGSALGPGDIEELKEIVESFGLKPLVLPDIGDSLDGHLAPTDFDPLTTGGTRTTDIAAMGESAATIVIGNSVAAAADLLHGRTGVPDYRFPHLMGLRAVDGLVDLLSRLSGRRVPERLLRQRAQLQDALLDSHFAIGMSRIGLAADPDLLTGLVHLLLDSGAEIPVAVTAAYAPWLADLPIERIKIGDLEDLETLSRDAGLDLLVGNSHLAGSAERMGLPLLRAGFPLYDRVGGYATCRTGYRGSRQTLFDLANLLLRHPRGEIAPYVSIFRRRQDESATSPAPAGRH